MNYLLFFLFSSKYSVVQGQGSTSVQWCRVKGVHSGIYGISQLGKLKLRALCENLGA